MQAGFRVTEVPITFTEREIGTSKMSGGIVREALLKVTWWGAAHRWQQVTGLFGLGAGAAAEARNAAHVLRRERRWAAG